MIISISFGNILHANTEAIIIPVNCVGVAGKGLAKQWADKFPDAYIQYKKRCEESLVRIGHILPTRQDGKWFLCFPTKTDWRLNSEIEYIQEGIKSLGQTITTLRIKSLAIPRLGCGNGGLMWEDVRHVIIEELEYLNENYNLRDLGIVIYEPNYKDGIE